MANVALYDLTVTMCKLVKYRKNNKTYPNMEVLFPSCFTLIKLPEVVYHNTQVTYPSFNGGSKKEGCCSE